jgi:DNA-binding MarR family transcriptional regulator
MPHPSSAAGSGRLPDHEAVRARYRDNWVRHLLGIAQDLDARVRGRLTQELGYEGLRPSLGPFLSLVWTEPRPLAELAEQLSISKQACSQLARLAEREGYLERVAGRADRALRVRLTRRGRRLVEDAVRMILEAEACYADRIGADRLRRFTAASASLFFGLGIQEQTDPTLSAAARRSLGVLPLIAMHVEEELRAATGAKGHADLKLSHARLFALVGRDGARVSEMARLQGVSRQAISATVRDLESLGYVRRDTDESDGRGIRVRVTARGEALMRDSMEALDELEATFRRILGRRRQAELVTTAAELHRALQLEAEVFGPEAGAPLASGPAPGTGASVDADALRSLAALLERRLGPEGAQRLGRQLLRKRSR